MLIMRIFTVSNSNLPFYIVLYMTVLSITYKIDDQVRETYENCLFCVTHNWLSIWIIKIPTFTWKITITKK